MVVKKFASVDQITKCHMLFIPEKSSNDLDAAIAKISGQSTLIMTERNGLGMKGSGINFITVDGKQKFEINKTTPISDYQNFGQKSAVEILTQGGKELMEEIRKKQPDK